MVEVLQNITEKVANCYTNAKKLKIYRCRERIENHNRPNCGSIAIDFYKNHYLKGSLSGTYLFFEKQLSTGCAGR
jgi:basic membrane lipoprotein Med (substrate-binding protein (PBP1-ABC) superfamily)